MSHCLAIDTSSEVTSVSLAPLDDPQVQCVTCKGDSSRGHAEELTTLVGRCLAQAELSYDDLRSICVNSGPGSFTGLRIGLSYAKGVCSAQHLPLFTFNTFEAAFAALQSHKTLESGVYFFISDARRGDVFVAAFQQGSEHQQSSRLLIEPQIIPFETVAHRQKELENQTGLPSYLYQLGTAVHTEVPPLPGSHSSLSVGLLELARSIPPGERTAQVYAPHLATPLYIRSVAAKSLKERGIEVVDILAAID